MKGFGFVGAVGMVALGCALRGPVSPPPTPRSGDVTVELRGDGVLVVDGEVVSDRELVARLGAPSRATLRADPAASYGAVARAMSRVLATGVEEIRLVE